MDTRLKIIILFFVIIIGFYFLQYVYSFSKKKEHFTSKYYDDVEHYEETPNEPDASKEYDLRLALLDEIEKIAKDSKEKSMMIEQVFKDENMKKFKDLSKSKYNEELKKMYDSMINKKENDKLDEIKEIKPPSEIEIKNPKKATESKDLQNQVKDFMSGSEMSLTPNIKDYFQNDYMNKTQKALDKLDNVIDGLKEMKDILKPDFNKEPYIPDLPLPPSELNTEKKNKTPVIDKTPVIEGFENIRSFAFY